MSLLALLGPVIVKQSIPLVVKLVDKIFGNKTGKIKSDVATKVVTSIVEGSVSTGNIGSSQVPSESDIRKYIDSVVAGLNSIGELKGPDTELVPDYAAAFDGVRMMLGGAMKVLESSIPKK